MSGLATSSSAASEATPLLALEQVDFSFMRDGKPLPILQQFHLQVQEGEFLTLLGPSGSGKSTIFKLIAGLLEPQEGAMRYRDRPFTQRLGRVSYMPQHDLLFPWRTVMENAILALEVKGVKKRESVRRAAQYLEAFGLAEVAEAYPYQLSGGMRQRVSFLRTVLGENELLLLDEPFGALDSLTRSQLQEWLLNLWQDLQKTVIFITHDVEEAVLLSDRICVLTHRPISQVEVVEVPLSRPRSLEMLTAESLVSLKAQLLSMLRGGAEWSS